MLSKISLVENLSFSGTLTGTERMEVSRLLRRWKTGLILKALTFWS
jgi:hypothetical protein